MLDIDPDALVVHTAAFFSPHDVHNFAVHAIDALRGRQCFAAAGDNFVSRTYVPDLVNAVLDLLLDAETGIRHLASQSRLSWAEFARALASADGLDPGSVRSVEAAHFGWRAPRPADVTLATECGQILPGIDDAISRFLRDYRPAQPG